MQSVADPISDEQLFTLATGEKIGPYGLPLKSKIIAKVNEITDPSLLDKLAIAQDVNHQVKRAIFNNPNTSLNTLKLLATNYWIDISNVQNLDYVKQL